VFMRTDGRTEKTHKPQPAELSVVNKTEAPYFKLTTCGDLAGVGKHSLGVVGCVVNHCWESVASRNFSSWRARGFSLNPIKYIPFMSVPRAAANDGSRGFDWSTVWTILTELEYSTIAGYILLVLLCFLLLVICFTSLRDVKRTALFVFY